MSPSLATVSNVLTKASTVGRFIGPCQTSGSAAYAAPTSGSRESAAGLIGMSGISSRASSRRGSGQSPMTGPDSTSAVSSAPYRWAKRAEIRPPMECPTMTSGMPGWADRASSATACTSVTTSSKSSITTRSPDDFPCPVWSGANTAAPCPFSTPATSSYRPECSP